MSYFSINDLIIGHKLEHGFYGTVNIAELNNITVAVKTIRINNIYNIDMYENEKNLLIEAQSKYIVKLIGFCEDIPLYPKIIFDFYNYSDLKNYIDRICIKYKFKIKALLQDTVYGLCHLAKLNIIHRDIKPENILIKKYINKRCNAVIADFGLAIKFFKNKINEKCGTKEFVAPEVNSRCFYGIEADVFSLGKTISVSLMKFGITYNEYRLIKRCCYKNPIYRLKINNIFIQEMCPLQKFGEKICKLNHKCYYAHIKYNENLEFNKKLQEIIKHNREHILETIIDHNETKNIEEIIKSINISSHEIIEYNKEKKQNNYINCGIWNIAKKFINLTYNFYFNSKLKKQN